MDGAQLPKTIGGQREGSPAAYTEIEEKCLTALGGTEGLEK
jgi:hypothetical protein